MHPVFATTPEALAEPLQRAGIAPYRAGQVLSWIYGRGVVDPEAMTNLPRELRALLAALDVDGCIFRSNHASNFLALGGTLRKDQARLVAALDAVLADPAHARFRPEWLRGL